MSTNVEVADVDKLRQAIADVRSDANGVNRKSWVVVGHVDNNPNLLEVKGHDSSEEANLDDFRELLEDDQVMYALVRTTTTVDMSATVRFVYVHWCVYCVTGLSLSLSLSLYIYIYIYIWGALPLYIYARICVFVCVCAISFPLSNSFPSFSKSIH